MVPGAGFEYNQVSHLVWAFAVLRGVPVLTRRGVPVQLVMAVPVFCTGSTMAVPWY